MPQSRRLCPFGTVVLRNLACCERPKVRPSEPRRGLAADHRTSPFQVSSREHGEAEFADDLGRQARLDAARRLEESQGMVCRDDQLHVTAQAHLSQRACEDQASAWS